MRKFTKTHNDLDWLFNDLSHYYSGEEWYDIYEKTANTLFDIAHENKEIFSKDDIIDAFMKGASTAHHLLNCNFSTYVSFLELQENEEFKNFYQNKMKELVEFNNKLQDEIIRIKESK